MWVSAAYDIRVNNRNSSLSKKLKFHVKIKRLLNNFQMAPMTDRRKKRAP